MFAAFYWLAATFAYAQAISSTELINNAKQYNGKNVVYQGEVIGDIMLRGDFAWININDGENALGVWIKKDLIKDIIFTGQYKTVGDWVQVEGLFNQRCIQHGGDLDLHAENMEIVKAGSQTPEFLGQEKIDLVIALGASLCLVALMYMHSYKRLKK